MVLIVKIGLIFPIQFGYWFQCMFLVNVGEVFVKVYTLIVFLGILEVAEEQSLKFD